MLNMIDFYIHSYLGFIKIFKRKLLFKYLKKKITAKKLVKIKVHLNLRFIPNLRSWVFSFNMKKKFKEF